MGIARMFQHRACAVTVVVGLATLVPGSPSFAAGEAAGEFDAGKLQTRADSGDAEAMFQLGTLEYIGLGIVQDYVGALGYLRKSADAGNAEAQCELAFLYQTGSFAQGPPPPDPADAAPWYEKSAAAGNPYGEFGLAALYSAGQGVSKDPAMAATLFAKAAAQGLVLDASSFPLQQLQRHFYAVAYKLTGQVTWVDLVSRSASLASAAR